LNYLRDQQRKDVSLTIRGVGNSGVVDIKEFYQLFPKGPLKLSSKFAGIPKPKSCI
jgi:tRNA 2-thiouridine synthesizing protein E